MVRCGCEGLFALYNGWALLITWAEQSLNSYKQIPEVLNLPLAMWTFMIIQSQTHPVQQAVGFLWSGFSFGHEKVSKDPGFLGSQNYHLNWQKHEEEIEAVWMLKLN